MTNPEPVDAPTQIVLPQEHLDVATRWEVSGRLRISKRVTTETRKIEVTLRREELVTEFIDPTTPAGPISIDEADQPRGLAGWDPNHQPEPLVIVLHEEIPQVTVTTRAYERATFTATRHSGDVPVSGPVRTENIALDQVRSSG